MSVVAEYTATPTRIVALLRFLRDMRPDGILRDELTDLFSPSALRPTHSPAEGAGRSDKKRTAETIAHGVLRAARELELVDYGTGRLAKVVLTAGTGVADDALKNLLEARLLSPNQKPFAQQLAWLMHQDPLRPLCSSKPVVDQRFGGQPSVDAPPFELGDDARRDNFVYWARWLGYVGLLRPNGKRLYLVPDPTDALIRHSPKYRGQREQSIGELLDRMGHAIPVLDRGTAWREVATPAARAAQQTTVSMAVAFAMMRLQRRGLWRLEYVDDAPSVDVAGSPLGRISKVIWADAA